MNAEPAEDATTGLEPLLDQCGTPWRAYRQEMAATALELAATGYELVGLTLELDLHEIGAVGEAMVLDIQPAPPVRLGAGRVVTGKFSHKSGDVIDLVLAGSDQESETIGTTSNHPFWSEDRRDYVQAGSLEEGERVLTFAGDTKRVVSKLARPGPQPVYNLEVHGEHVYHVGKDGVLVHNMYGDPDAPKGAVRGFHGTDGDNILSILDDGALRPRDRRVFLSEVSDTFPHGVDLKRNAAFTLELDATVSAGTVTRTSVPGNPRTIEVTSSQNIPVEIRRLHIRRPNGTGGFTFETIEGTEAIRTKLRSE